MTVPTSRLLTLAPAARELTWQDWGDGDYSVYQRTSAETHVFNETTALLLARLGQGPTTLEAIRVWTADVLGIVASDLPSEVLVSTACRLEELGLIEWRDSATVGL